MEWFSGGLPDHDDPAENARRRLRERQGALIAGRSASSPASASVAVETAAAAVVPSKGTLAAEASVQEDGNTRRVGSGKRSSRSSRYLTQTTRGKVSSRLERMQVQEKEKEKQEKKAAMTARLSARRSARSASERYRANPLPTTSHPSPEWRQWPGGKPPGERDVTRLWKELADARQTTRAFSAIVLERQTEQRRQQQQVICATDDGSGEDPALVASPISPAQGEEPQSPPGDSEPSPTYGSQRPLSKQERRFQLEKHMERNARKRLQELRAQHQEQEAVQELESKRRRNDLLRSKREAKSARGLQRGERKLIQQRLYASPRKPQSGAVYG